MRIPALLLLLFISAAAAGQSAGRRSYTFLTTASTPRLGALGGVNVSLADRDVNFFLSNPALAGDTLNGWASAGYHFYLADIGQTTLAYQHNFKKIGAVSFGVQHIGYGTLTGYDASGMETGDFNSQETALVIGKSHQRGHFRMGANVKAAFSSIAGYRSSAVLVDFGGIFIHPNQQLVVGLAIKNLGIMLSEYSGTSETRLPFDVQVGASFKPQYMPIRFSITAYNFAQRNVTYFDATSQNEEPGTLDKVLRRFNFAAEVLLGKNVTAMVGYNYQIHQELKLDNAGGGAGISLGLSARIKSVEMVISRSGYVAGSAGYAFAVMTNVDNLLRRRS